jgi:uncharacterized integral membrane protein
LSLKGYLGLLLVLLVGLLILQNTEVVEIRFLFWSLSMSRVLLLPLVFGAGVLVGWALHTPRRKLQ